MPRITGHRFDEKGRIIFIVESPKYDLVEHVTAREMLTLDPEAVELYQYFYGEPGSLKIEKPFVNKAPLQSKIQSMIAYYIDMEHNEAAMDIMENVVASKRQPSQYIIFVLLDLLLRPQPKYRSFDRKELLKTCQRAQRVLFHILESCGPDVFRDVWLLFRMNPNGRLDKRKRALQIEAELEDDEDEPYQSSLHEFDDLWDLAAKCINLDDTSNTKKTTVVPMTPPSMEAPAGHQRRRMVLDVLISVLESDLRNRRGSEGNMEKCVFLSLLRTDSMGGRSQFDRYLDIIFSAFGYKGQDETGLKTDAESIEFAGRLMNMLVVLSYCENLVATSALLEQTFRRFNKLDVDGCANLMQVIRCTTFTSALCDLEISDSDCSCVEEKYRHLRNGKKGALRMDKVIHFNMKTRPLRRGSLKDVYRHVMMVAWRFMNFVNERSLRCDICREPNDGIIQKNISSLRESESLMIIEHGPGRLEEWERHVEDMIQEARLKNPDEPGAAETEQKIRWTLQLAKLNIDAF